MSEQEKKNKKLGIIITGTFHVLVVLLLFAFSMSTDGKKEEPVMLVMDFSAGSSSAGGSSAASKTSEPTEDPQPVNKVDPVKTQTQESPVKKSNKARSESATKKNSNEKKPNTDALANGAFGGNGTGQANGDGNGENEGIGDGENGPGVKGKIGSLGSGDGIPPAVVNPTRDQEGKVVIEITVDKKGSVIDVKVLSNHKKTTTTDPVLLNQAKKDGFRYKFKPDNRRAELSKGLRIINYVLR